MVEEFQEEKGCDQRKVSEDLGRASPACPLPPDPLTSGRMESREEPQVPDGARERAGPPPVPDSFSPATNCWRSRG